MQREAEYEKMRRNGKNNLYGLLEQYISSAIKRKLSLLSPLSVPAQNNLCTDSQQNEAKIRLSQIDMEIEQLLAKISSAGDILMGYINKKIKQLDTERNKIKEEIKRKPDNCNTDNNKY